MSAPSNRATGAKPDRAMGHPPVTPSPLLSSPRNAVRRYTLGSLRIAAVTLLAILNQCGTSPRNDGTNAPTPSSDAGADTAPPDVSTADDVASPDGEPPPKNDAPDGRFISEEEWARITGLVEGPSDVERFPNAGCPVQPIPADYRVLPTVACAWNPDHDRRVDPVRDCTLQPYCRSHADCTATNFGRCRGSANALCVYPDVPNAPCTQASECTALPNGSCPRVVEPNTTLCYPTGRCEKREQRCFYREQPCSNDADCTSAPGGTCVKRILFARCEAQACLADGDCATGTRCACNSPANVCVPADCASDADCASGERCQLERRCNGVAAAYHCTTPLDTCREQADCGSSYCTFEGHWACRALNCPIIE